MKRKKWMVLGILLVFLWGSGTSAALAMSNVTVVLPVFPVVLNGQVIDSHKASYPLLVYKDVTYVPMTEAYETFLGLDCFLQKQTQTVKKTKATRETLPEETAKKANQKTYKASILDKKVAVQGSSVQNRKETYPLLLFRDVVYFPLTWQYTVEEFGWDNRFDAQKGLWIDTRATEGQRSKTIISTDHHSSVTVDYRLDTDKNTLIQIETVRDIKSLDGYYQNSVSPTITSSVIGLDGKQGEFRIQFYAATKEDNITGIRYANFQLIP